MSLEADLPAGGRELDSVIEEALEHLGQGDGVAGDDQAGGIDVHRDRLPLGRGLCFLRSGARGKQVSKVAGLALESGRCRK